MSVRSHDLPPPSPAATPGTDQLEELSRLAELGLQVSALVHELRQPLALIKGYAQLLAERAAPETVATAPPLMVEQCARMEVMLERLRAYARGRADHLLEYCDLREALARALELLGHPRRTAGLVVARDLPPELPPARVDPIAAEQILHNLLSNAHDAIGERGTVTVRAWAEPGQVVVEVADTGPGVGADHAAHLFVPFATTKAKGTGLGLWLSRKLAERHGGTLVFVPSEGGARFQLRLPASGARAPENAGG